MNLEAGNACGYCNAVVLGEPFPALFNIFQRYWAKSQTEVGGKSAGAVYLREESSAGHLLTSTGGEAFGIHNAHYMCEVHADGSVLGDIQPHVFLALVFRETANLLII